MSLERYSRQILFKPFAREGQERLRAARVTVIGCGALGTVSAEMLVRAGVGSLILVDRDFVELSNLHRQSLFAEEDVREGLPKAVAARRALARINSEVELSSVVADVASENIADICSSSEVLVDGTDNFETRYLINDFAVANRKPWVYGACLGGFGTACLIEPGLTPCLRCLCDEPPPSGGVETCDTAGVIGPVVHVVAAFQVAQIMKLFASDTHRNWRLLQADVWEDNWRTLSVSQMKRADCECCVERRFRFLAGGQESRLTRLCGRNAVQVSPGRSVPVDFEALARRLAVAAEVSFNDYLMTIQLTGHRIVLFPDGRSIIQGTEDFGEARSLYARYIGM
jgi:molybdopterin-synthase adenylyltransferase